MGRSFCYNYDDTQQVDNQMWLEKKLRNYLIPMLKKKPANKLHCQSFCDQKFFYMYIYVHRVLSFNA